MNNVVYILTGHAVYVTPFSYVTFSCLKYIKKSVMGEEKSSMVSLDINVFNNFLCILTGHDMLRSLLQKK